MKTIARIVFRILLPLAIIGATGWGVRELYLTQPGAAREQPAATVPVVNVISLASGSQPITVEAFGTVIPARRMLLRTQVGGRITGQHAALVPGGVLPAGAEVIRFDPTDYELRVRQEQVAIASAQAAFDLERGQQVVAAKEWNLLKDEIDAPEEMEDFALRRPQQRRAQSEVEAAENRLALAQLDLERTVVAAPFNALVLSESVEVGQLVSTQNEVAELVGTDEFWVQVPVPFETLGRLRFGPEEASPARVFVPGATAAGVVARDGQVRQLLGDLSERGRMARLLVGVRDPLCLADDVAPETPRLLLNSYVRVEIDAGRLEDVVEIPRAALRENDQVWVATTDDRLRIRDVTILWRKPDSVLVANDFDEGERLIVSRLAVVVPQMRVRVATADGRPVAEPVDPDPIDLDDAEETTP